MVDPLRKLHSYVVLNEATRPAAAIYVARLNISNYRCSTCQELLSLFLFCGDEGRKRGERNTAVASSRRTRNSRIAIEPPAAVMIGVRKSCPTCVNSKTRMIAVGG